MSDPRQIAAALAAPFDPSEVKFKPAVVSGTRALALAYVDARVIQDRLDAVLGVDGWQDAYTLLPDGSVVCKLRCKIGEQWITKTDVGGPSEQPDEGDRRKAAFSDALKRAAVKFGVGRFLYGLPAQWVDYDPQRRQFVRQPQLPACALAGRPAGEPSDLLARVQAFDARLVEAGLCQPGECAAFVRDQGARAGLPQDMARWPGRVLDLATHHAKAFEAERRQLAVSQRNGYAGSGKAGG